MIHHLGNVPFAGDGPAADVAFGHSIHHLLQLRGSRANAFTDAGYVQLRAASAQIVEQTLGLRGQGLAVDGRQAGASPARWGHSSSDVLKKNGISTAAVSGAS